MSDPVSRFLILSTTFLLGFAGVVFIFAPVEVAGAVGVPEPAGVALLVQLYGAALFGLAMSGWMVRDAVVGGIFGRSYVVGNAAHAGVGALVLVRPAVSAGAASGLRAITLVYWLLALAFGYLMFIAVPQARKRPEG
ncbi:MAG TPA: hypothetical protein VIG47_17390 [Gemmatimonadaceae bacterium]